MSAAMEARPGATDAIKVFSGEIATPRLVLRPGTVDDSEPMFDLFNDWEVVRWLARPNWPQDLGIISESLKRLDGEKAEGSSLYLAICHQGVLVGGVAWTVSEANSHIGYWIGQRFWGRGFVTEAAGALCDTIFAVSREPVLYSGVFMGNHASMRVQQKLGFVQIGSSVHHCVPRGIDMTHWDTKLTRTARRAVLEHEADRSRHA